jgi:hypothetical protein
MHFAFQTFFLGSSCVKLFYFFHRHAVVQVQRDTEANNGMHVYAAGARAEQGCACLASDASYYWH